MGTRAKKHAICFLVALIMVIAVMAAIALTAEAKTGMYSRNSDGDVFISETGWVQIGSDTYYVHSTKSRAYRKYEACRNTYRWREGKLYYFGDDGKMIRKSTKYIKLNRDRSVKYVYTPGTGRSERWNASLLRYQQRKKDGGWRETGNQTNLWWSCDWQL